MEKPNPAHTESSEAVKGQVKAFAESSGFPHGALLKLIEKWRHLQSGSSNTKAPAYSTEG